MTTVRTDRVLRCAYCDEPGERLYDDLKDRLCDVEGAFGINRCPACSLLWLDPRPVPEDIMKCYGYFAEKIETAPAGPLTRRLFGNIRDMLRESILCGYFGYRSTHAKHTLRALGRVLGAVPAIRRRATSDMGGLIPRAPSGPGSLLVDVGCGRGEYLEWIQGLGWKVLGIEPHPTAADIAEANGMPIVRKDLFAAHLPDRSAECVSMMHVIEHFYDPLAALRECWRILEPGGRLILRTPNAGSLGHSVFKRNWIALDPPRHLFIFSSKSMRSLFNKTSFRKVHIVSVTRPIECNYSSSVVLARGERLPAGSGEKKSGGMRWFSFLEQARLLIGQPVGEELQVVAVK